MGYGSTILTGIRLEPLCPLPPLRPSPTLPIPWCCYPDLGVEKSDGNIDVQVLVFLPNEAHKLQPESRHVRWEVETLRSVLPLVLVGVENPHWQLAVTERRNTEPAETKRGCTRPITFGIVASLFARYVSQMKHDLVRRNAPFTAALVDRWCQVGVPETRVLPNR